MASLRDALSEAFAILRAGTGSPWILTDDGLILTPAHLIGMMLRSEDGEATLP